MFYSLQALCKAEDETDAQAATQVQAEQKAELAEFDENIPWDERETEAREEDDISKVEIELAMLDKEVCFSICFLHGQVCVCMLNHTWVYLPHI